MVKINQAGSDLTDRKYRPLKKLLKKSWEKIQREVAHGKLPSSLVMDEFMAQSKVMVSYPGFGDENYQEFTESCAALYQAFRAKNLQSFTDELGRVIGLKESCHNRYR